MNAAAFDYVESSTTKNDMKKLITITAAAVIGLGGLAFTASAHEPDEDVPGNVEQQRTQETIYEQHGSRGDEHRVFEHRKDQDPIGRLNRDVDHLNRMVDHVRAEMSEYRADRHIQSEFEHLRAEAYDLNNQFRRGVQYYDRRRLRAQIAHMHSELHHIEQELHVRAEGYYQWR